MLFFGWIIEYNFTYVVVVHSCIYGWIDVYSYINDWIVVYNSYVFSWIVIYVCIDSWMLINTCIYSWIEAHSCIYGWHIAVYIVVYCFYTQSWGKSLRLKIYLCKQRPIKDKRKRLSIPVLLLIEFIKGKLH